MFDVLTRFSIIILLVFGLSDSLNYGYYRGLVYPPMKHDNLHITNAYRTSNLNQRPLRKQYGYKYNQHCIGLDSNVPTSFVDDLHKVVKTITSKSLDDRMQFDTQKAWSLFSDKVKTFLDELNFDVFRLQKQSKTQGKPDTSGTQFPDLGKWHPNLNRKQLLLPEPSINFDYEKMEEGRRTYKGGK